MEKAVLLRPPCRSLKQLSKKANVGGARLKPSDNLKQLRKKANVLLEAPVQAT